MKITLLVLAGISVLAVDAEATRTNIRQTIRGMKAIQQRNATPPIAVFGKQGQIITRANGVGKPMQIEVCRGKLANPNVLPLRLVLPAEGHRGVSAIDVARVQSYEIWAAAAHALRPLAEGRFDGKLAKVVKVNVPLPQGRNTMQLLYDPGVPRVVNGKAIKSESPSSFPGGRIIDIVIKD